MYQRIRDLREDRDLMQKDLAAYLKCTQVCYSNYETGKRDIPTDVLKALSLYYDTSVDYILGLTDEPKPGRNDLLCCVFLCPVHKIFTFFLLYMSFTFRRFQILHCRPILRSGRKHVKSK